MPTYLLEFSQDPLSDTTPAWTDVTAYFLEGSYTRDGGGDLDDPAAGTATFRLNNTDRRFEPEYAAGAYYPNIRPLRRWRLSIDGDVEFTGFATKYDVAWPDEFIAGECTVSCVDGRHLLELEALPALEPSSASTYEEVVSDAQPWGYWRLGEPEGTKMVSHVRKEKRRGYTAHGYQPVIRTTKTKYKTQVTRAEVEGVAGPSGTYKNTPTLGQPGAILGDPGTSVLFASTDNEWARIRLDDDDALNKIRGLTVECWIKANWTTTTLGTAIIQGPTTLGTDAVFFISNDGGGTVFQIKGAGFTGYLAQSTTIRDSTVGWFHCVGVWDGSTVKLYINGVEVDSEAASSTLSPVDADGEIWIGRINTLYSDHWMQEVAIYEKALEPETILGHYIAGTARGWAEELAGDRIEDIVTHDLWAVGSVQSGALTVTPQMKHGQTILEELDRTLECERPNNVFYISGAGNPVYLGWDFGDVSPYNTVQATYGENGGGEIPYEAMTLDYDEELYNEVTVARDGGEGMISSDPDSQDEFRLRRYQASGLILSDDDDAAVVADTILERFKQPALRVTSVTLNGADSSALTEIKAREPGQLIRVKRRPSGGTAIDRVCRIKSKTVNINPGSYKNPLMATFTLTRGFNAATPQWRLGIIGFTELDGVAAVLG